jgi:hypothetical protein
MFETAGIAKNNGMLVPADHFGSTSQSLSMSPIVESSIIFLDDELLLSSPDETSGGRCSWRPCHQQSDPAVPVIRLQYCAIPFVRKNVQYTEKNPWVIVLSLGR